jgi:hypothetical protein
MWDADRVDERQIKAKSEYGACIGQRQSCTGTEQDRDRVGRRQSRTETELDRDRV